MRFTVFALATIPDIDTARKNFDLADLDDKDVAKVLFHQRKQQTGHSEKLNWDQRQIAGLSMVQHSLDYVDVVTDTLETASEVELIEKYYMSLGLTGRTISWDGNREALPLLHFRCMKHRFRDSLYWEAENQGNKTHSDIRELIAPASAELPGLDVFATRFHYPGALGLDDSTNWDAYLAGDYQRIAQYAAFRALKTYLVALDILSLHGEMSSQDAARARKKLRDYLAAGKEPYFKLFLEQWEDRQ